MRTARSLTISTLFAPMVFAACSSSTSGNGLDASGMDVKAPADTGVTTPPDSGTPPADSGMRPDGGTQHDGSTPDAMQADTGPVDSGPNPYGTKLADFPNAMSAAQIVWVPYDESHIFFLNGMDIFSVPAAGGTAADLGPGPMIWYPVPGNNLWMMTTLGTSTIGPSVGDLAVLASTSTGAPVVRVPAIVQSQVFIAPDTNHVLAATHLRQSNMNQIVDIVVSGADGTMHNSLSNVHVTNFNNMAGAFTAPCPLAAAYVSNTVAFFIACTNPAMGLMDTPKLYRVDLTTGNSTVVGATSGGASAGFVIASPDKSSVLFTDANDKVVGVDATGMTVVSLVETTMVTAVAFLNGTRFAYQTMGNAVKVAAYPAMMPSTITATGAKQLNPGSMNGGYVTIVQNQHTPLNGLGDLYLLPTSTAAADTPIALSTTLDCYPGDNTFSADSQYVYWYSGADSNFIGDIHSMRTSGGGAGMVIGPRSYLVNNYADPNGVVLLQNAGTKPAGMGMVRVVADLAVRKRDGSSAATVLAPQIDATDFLLFPRTKTKFVLKVLDDPSNLGLYVHDLPPTM